MRIQFVQNGRFYGRGDSLRREVIERLRGAFGEKRVREGRFNWRGFEKCPPLSQIDSGA